MRTNFNKLIKLSEQFLPSLNALQKKNDPPRQPVVCPQRPCN